MILPLLAIPFVGALATWLFRPLYSVRAGLAAASALAVALLALTGMDSAPFVLLGRTIALEPATRAHLSLAMALLALTLAASTLPEEHDVAGALALAGLGMALLFMAVQNLILATLILQAGLVILVLLIPQDAGTLAPVNMRILVMLVMAGMALSTSAWLMDNPSTASLGSVALVIGACAALGAFPFFVWQLPIYRSGSSLAQIMFGVVLPHLILVRILALPGGLLALAGGAPAILLLNGGIASFVVGCLGAWAQRSAGGALGYMALGEIGFVMMALGSGTSNAQEVGLLHLFLRGVALVALCVGAAVLRHSFGSDDLERVRGVFRRAPLTSVGMLLAGLSLAGFPPLGGFITRLALYRDIGTQAPGWAVALAAIGLAPACAVVRFGIAAFQVAPLPESRPEPLWPAILVLVLGIVLLVVGVAPQTLDLLPAEWFDLLLSLGQAAS